MRIVELEVNEELEGVETMSFVQFPAIEADFRFFSKVQPKQKLTLAKVDTERRLVFGPAMIPDKMIYRIDEQTGEEYHVWFSQATVRKAAYSFLKAGRQASVNEEHSKRVSDVTLVESWMVESKQDKSVHLGYDVALGTWMVGYHVDNDELWEKVKSGKVKGFSIEGWFAEALSAVQNFRKATNDELLGYLKKMLKDDPTKAEMVGWDVQWAIQSTIADRIKEDADFLSSVQKLVSKTKAPDPNDARVRQKNFDMTFLEKIRAKVTGKSKFATATLEDGQTITNGTEEPMAVGDSVSLVTEDGEIALPDGDYTLSDGTMIVVAGGVIETLTAPEAGAKDEEVDMAAAIAAAVEAAIAPLIERLDKLEASHQEHESAIEEVATKMSATETKVKQVAKAPAGESIKQRLAASEDKPKETPFSKPRNTAERVRQTVEQLS
jgi:hypothetical protein